MKTTEKVLGMIIIACLLIISGIIGLIGSNLAARSDYIIPLMLLASGVLGLSLAFTRHRSYTTNPELRKRDEIGARDERTLLIRLKSTDVASFGVFIVGVILIQLYDYLLTDYLDVLFPDTLTLLKVLFVFIMLLWISLYGIAYFIFQRIN